MASGEARLIRMASKLLTSSTRPLSPRSRPRPRGGRDSPNPENDGRGASAGSMESKERSDSVVDIVPPLWPASDRCDTDPKPAFFHGVNSLVGSLLVAAQIDPVEI